MRRRWPVKAVLAVTLLSCTRSGPTDPNHDGSGPALGTIARATARIAADPVVRQTLLLAMHESPLVDHKLALEDWIRTPAGSAFLTRLAAAEGLPADSASRLVNSLAPLDLYVPDRVARQTWTGDAAPVVLLAPTDKDRTIRRYDADGSVSIVSPNASLGRPILLIQRSEGRSTRITRSISQASAVIEDRNDGDVGGSLTIHMAGEPPRTFQLADISGGGLPHQEYCPPEIPGCPGEGGGGGGGGGVLEGAGEGHTYLTGLVVYNVNDNGILHESNEFEFRTTAYVGLTTIGYAVLRLEGVDYDYDNQAMNRHIFPYAPTGGAYVKVDVVETDGWPNDDDQFDLVQYQPNQVFFRIPLEQPEDDNFWWPLKEQPYIAYDDPFKVVARFHWTP